MVDSLVVEALATIPDRLRYEVDLGIVSYKGRSSEASIDFTETAIDKISILKLVVECFLNGCGACLGHTDVKPQQRVMPERSLELSKRNSGGKTRAMGLRHAAGSAHSSRVHGLAQ